MSCTIFTVQADGSEVTTIEGLARDGQLHPLQEGFWEEHGLQCGYCTPGMILSAVNQGTIRSARIGLTGAASHATRLTNVEEMLAGKTVSTNTIEAAAELAGTGLSGVASDLHASEEYRRAMIRVFTRRALEGALARANA